MRPKRKKYFSYNEIRTRHYKEKKTAVKKLGNTDLDNWLSSPYSSLKAIFYIELCVPLVFLLQYTNITPNFLTVNYIILGFIGGIFLSIDNQSFILAGIIIFFSKTIVDWSDGLLARMKNKTSELGHILDCWGGIVGGYSFIVGLGMYLYNKYEDTSFLIFIIVILLLKSLDIKNFSYIISIHTLLSSKNKKKIVSAKSKSNNRYNVSKTLIYIKSFFINLFDDRSRSVDFICLLILIDTFYIEINFIKYIFYFIIFKSFVLFFGSFYVVYLKDFLKNIKII